MVTSRMSNDCVVTALANYTGYTYDEVLHVLNVARGANEGQGKAGYYRETWLFALACLTGRQPQPGRLLTHGLLRFQHISGKYGHLVVVHEDGTIVDGSLAHGSMVLSAYERRFPDFIIDEVWQ